MSHHIQRYLLKLYIKKRLESLRQQTSTTPSSVESSSMKPVASSPPSNPVESSTTKPVESATSSTRRPSYPLSTSTPVTTTTDISQVQNFLSSKLQKNKNIQISVCHHIIMIKIWFNPFKKGIIYIFQQRINVFFFNLSHLKFNIAV